MTNKRGVFLVVDPAFFKTFEKERKQQESILRKKNVLSSFGNLTQKRFTALLAAKNFRFQIPKQQPLIKRKRKRR